MKIHEGYAIQEVLGAHIIVDTTAQFSGVIKINDTMAEIFAGILAGQGKDQIANKLCEKFDVDFEKARADVDKALSDLIAQGVVDE